MEHTIIDQRSLAMAHVIARRVRENPQLLDLARANIERWLATCSPNSRSALLEWKSILQDGLDAAVAILCGTDEQSARLRQSNPFAGEAFLLRKERTGIILEFDRRNSS